MSIRSFATFMTLFLKVRKIPKMLKQGKTIDEIVDIIFKGAPNEVKEFAGDLLRVALKARAGEISTEDAVRMVASKFGMQVEEFMSLVSEVVEMLTEAEEKE